MSRSARPSSAPLREVEASTSASLQRLLRGDMSLEDYLDERTELALDHVRGRVSAEVLETVRVTIREQLRTDPVLVAMVQRVTGQVIQPSDSQRRDPGHGEQV